VSFESLLFKANQAFPGMGWIS